MLEVNVMSAEEKMELVKLISITPDAEKIMGYCARVSNPNNQNNPEVGGLLNYCVKHGHWSVFEQANMLVEVRTSRAIAPQILRHRSFTFQEFSQRYAAANQFVSYEARRQDKTNRQNSIADLSLETQAWFTQAQNEVWEHNYGLYQKALELGIAKECARVLLPLSTATTLYMNGTIRSWIHYIELRSSPETQKEHREIALACKAIFVSQLPIVAKALNWT